MSHSCPRVIYVIYLLLIFGWLSSLYFEFHSSHTHCFCLVGCMRKCEGEILMGCACLFVQLPCALYLTVYISQRCFPFLNFLSVTALTSWVASPKTFYNWHRIYWSRNQLWNCTQFRYPTDERQGNLQTYTGSTIARLHQKTFLTAVASVLTAHTVFPAFVRVFLDTTTFHIERQS